MLRTIFLLLFFINAAMGANILAIMVVMSHSHHFWNIKYLEALAAKGHTITYLGIDEYKNAPKNIRHLYVEGVYEQVYSSTEIDFNVVSKLGPYDITKMMVELDDAVIPLFLKSPDFQKFMNIIKTEKFDLVINDVGGSLVFLLGSIDVLKAPVIGITAFGIPPWAFDIIGNPPAYSSTPHSFLSYTNYMSIFERINNVFLHAYGYKERSSFLDRQSVVSRNVFGNETRDLKTIFDDMNIILVNYNLAMDYPFPMLPGFIPISGLHIKPPKKLPEDLQKYLDNAKDGIIYMSFGSNVLSSGLNNRTIGILLEAFKQISPVQVLWKWEKDTLPGKPDNVMIKKWLPQNDVLAHPNVKAFFTHFGLLSTQESIYHGVPLVGIPFVLDQHVNAKKCVDQGVAQSLNFDDLNVEDVIKALREVIDNPKYKTNMERLSLVFRDSETSPLDRAVYWTEYAIRHKGAKHFRSSIKDLKWYQNWLVDVVLVLLSVFLLATSLVYQFLRFVGLLFISKKSHISHKKKTK